MDDVTAIARLVDALRPWLGHLVIVGGWAHRLHRFHPLAHSPAYQPLRTRDADIVFSLTAPLKGDIHAALRAAGFTDDLSGEFKPPVMQYRLGTEDQGFYVEFLTPLHGGGLKRDGAPDATVRKAGITAQKLRHLDLLLVSPWTVRLARAVGVPVQRPLDVLVANPVSFLAQKLLIQKHRTPDKQAQDALYVHDTLDLFGRELTKLKALWLEQIRLALPPKTAKTVERLRGDQFGVVTDVIRNAARIPQDRTLAPDRMQATCAYGLEQIFGG